MLDLPTRQAAIEQAKANGQRIAAVLPIHYPRELLRACALHPVEVWGPPGVDSAAAGSHFQAYTCAIVQNATAFLLAGGLEVADLLLVPHACDALQGMGSVLMDFVRPRQPVVTFYLPRGTRPIDIDYLGGELRQLAAKLSAVSGVMPSAERLHAAIDTEVRADSAAGSMAWHREQFAMSDLDFYRVLRAREYLAPERFMELVAAAPRGKRNAAGVPLFISGIVPEPMAMFDALESYGAHVVGDDFAAISRRIYPDADDVDPYRRLAKRMLAGPPEWVRAAPFDERFAYLDQRIDAGGARGVVMYDVKFCEPELFELPLWRKHLAARDISLLHLEVELDGALDNQLRTRLEAFVESLS